MNAQPTAGLGLKPQHYAEALAAPAAGLWFEVHPENYMCPGGPRLAWLQAIRERHPLSLHGVGLSLAADEDPDPAHLAALKRLVDRFQPFVVSHNQQSFPAQRSHIRNRETIRGTGSHKPHTGLRWAIGRHP